MSTKTIDLDPGVHMSVPVTLLEPHPIIQRNFKQAHADHIRANFDAHAFGELTITKVGGKSKKYYVTNGQHRLWAVLALFGTDQEVPCNLSKDQSLADLAKHCLITNAGKAWTALERWHLRVIAREQNVLEIEAILHRFELHVDGSSREGVVRAVAALEALHKQGAYAHLERVIKILTRSYSRDYQAFDANILRGLGFFLRTFGPDLDEARLVQRITKSGGPAQLLSHARNLAEITGTTVTAAMAERLRMMYNKGLRNNQLKPRAVVAKRRNP